MINNVTLDAFVDEIADSPNNPGLRWILADWLEENGETASAAFLRHETNIIFGIPSPEMAGFSDGLGWLTDPLGIGLMILQRIRMMESRKQSKKDIRNAKRRLRRREKKLAAQKAES